MISMIAAIGQNFEIGFENKLIWHISEDLKRFKKLTINKTILMGRSTYESIGRALPQRKNIVLSTNQNLKLPGVEICNSYQELVDKYLNIADELFIIGGESIYSLFLPFTSKIYLSQIESSHVADKFFPRLDFKKWKTDFQERVESDPPHLFKILTKI